MKCEFKIISISFVKEDTFESGSLETVQLSKNNFPYAVNSDRIFLKKALE